MHFKKVKKNFFFICVLLIVFFLFWLFVTGFFLYLTFSIKITFYGIKKKYGILIWTYKIKGKKK